MIMNTVYTGIISYNQSGHIKPKWSLKSYNHGGRLSPDFQLDSSCGSIQYIAGICTVHTEKIKYLWYLVIKEDSRHGHQAPKEDDDDSHKSNFNTFQ